MKKRVGTFILALVMACSLAIPVGAVNVQQAPEELYQEYLNVVAAINEEYGTDVEIIPFEEMNHSDMPTVTELETTVRELAELQMKFAEGDVTVAPIEKSGGSTAVPMGGMGNYPVSTMVVGTVGEKTFRFFVSVTLIISTPSGTPSYYIQATSNSNVTAYTVPSGYTVDGTGYLVTTTVSSNKRTCTIAKTFRVKKDSAYTSVRPTATFIVNAQTGNISSSNHGM